MQLNRRIFSASWMIITLSYAAIAAAPATLPDLSFKLQNNVLEILPPNAHHFNVEAPSSVLESGHTLKFKVAKLKLTVTLPAKPQGKSIEVAVFVCDDAKTYCLKKRQTLLLPGAATPNARETAAPFVPTTTKLKRYTDLKTGFIVNDPKKAFRIAEKKKLPLMIDFFGIWCPPCNHLDAMVFEDQKFKARNGQRFVRLKLDADHEQFNTLRNRYKIQGLPTLIFATSSGDEIFRLIGFHPLEEVMAKADSAFINRSIGYAELSRIAKGVNPEAQYQAARIALDRDEPAQALSWLQPLEKLLIKTHDSRLALLYGAQLGVAQRKDDKTEAKRVLKQWLNDFPESVDSIENYQTLAELEGQAGDAAAKRTALTNAATLTEKLMANPGEALRDSYYSAADLAQTRAGIYEELGNAEHARDAYLLCAEAYSKEAQAEGDGFARGPNLEKAYCLGKAGRSPESEAIYREGIRRFPKEYTFYQGLAKLMLEAGKDPKKALEASEQALRFAYGGQRLKATLTQAKALEALKNNRGAIQAIENALRTPLPENASPGTIKLRKKLEAEKQELQKKLM